MLKKIKIFMLLLMVSVLHPAESRRATGKQGISGQSPDFLAVPDIWPQDEVISEIEAQALTNLKRGMIIYLVRGRYNIELRRAGYETEERGELEAGKKAMERGRVARSSGEMIVEGDTVRDSSSGLIWQRRSEGQHNRRDAKRYCENLVLGGHSDWRLPTIIELRSLIRGCPATETGGTCNIGEGCMRWGCRHSTCRGCSRDQKPPEGCYWPGEMEGTCRWYWSSSPVEDYGGSAWGVVFDLGSVSYGNTRNYLHVRCVR